MGRRIAVGVAVGLGIALAAPPGAKACGGRGGGGGYANPKGLEAGLTVGMVAVAVTDVALTVADTAGMVTGQPASPGYAVFELVVAAPQLILGISGLSGGYGGAAGGYTLWMAALTWHGIWTLATAKWDSPTAGQPNALRSQAAPELSVAIGPTYVPLGPLARAGFGLSGRF